MIHPLYAQAVEKTLSSISHEGTLQSDGAAEIYSATRDLVQLTLLVDNHRVVDAKYTGAQGGEKAILEVLCELAKDRPLRELSEHGMIYVEARLRDPEMTPPLLGLLTPENADPAFQIPQQLIREIYGKYSQANPPKGKNFWSPRPTTEWAKLGEVGRHKQVQAVMMESCRELGLQEEGVEIVSVKNTRVILSVNQAADKPAFGNAMIRLERRMKEKLGLHLELLLESIEDKNKRLSRTHISREAETT